MTLCIQIEEQREASRSEDSDPRLVISQPRPPLSLHDRLLTGRSLHVKETLLCLVAWLLGLLGSLVFLTVDVQVGWIDDWLIGWLIGWLVGCLAGWVARFMFGLVWIG